MLYLVLYVAENLLKGKMELIKENIIHELQDKTMIGYPRNKLM